MSNKPKTGDKYVIEIEGVYGRQTTIPAGVHSMDIPFFSADPSTLYKIKGFPSVVFTEEDLKKLEKYEEKSEKQPEEPEIKVGDEVRGDDGKRVAVTRVYWEAGVRYFEGVDGDGDIRDGLVSDVEPTGRKVTGVKEALEYLRSGIRR